LRAHRLQDGDSKVGGVFLFLPNGARRLRALAFQALRSIFARVTVGAVGAVALGVAVLASAALIAVSLVGEPQRPLAVLDPSTSEAFEAAGDERATSRLTPRAGSQDGTGTPAQDVPRSSSSMLPDAAAKSDHSATAARTPPDMPNAWPRSITTRGATTLVHVSQEGIEPGSKLKLVWRDEVHSKMGSETTLVTIWEPDQSGLRVTTTRQPGESDVEFVGNHVVDVLGALLDRREVREGKQ
jgi:hypothetical protein